MTINGNECILLFNKIIYELNVQIRDESNSPCNVYPDKIVSEIIMESCPVSTPSSSTLQRQHRRSWRWLPVPYRPRNLRPPTIEQPGNLLDPDVFRRKANKATALQLTLVRPTSSAPTAVELRSGL